MPTTLNELKTAAASLSSDEQSELMDFLVQLPDAEAVKAEWKAVARRRLDEMKDGTVTPVPFDQIFKRQAG